MLADAGSAIRSQAHIGVPSAAHALHEPAERMRGELRAFLTHEDEHEEFEAFIDSTGTTPDRPVSRH